MVLCWILDTYFLQIVELANHSETLMQTCVLPARRWLIGAGMISSPDEAGLALSLQCCRLLREGYAQVSFLGAWLGYNKKRCASSA